MAYNEFLLKNLARNHTGKDYERIEKIPQSGSNRLYFRLIMEKEPPLIGVYNHDVKENEAFFYLTNHFQQYHIPAPFILAVDDSRQYYLLNDLGDETLYSFLTRHREDNSPDREVMAFYRKVLEKLPDIQFLPDIDYTYSYPRAAFDRQSMLWDLNYFKYYFLKLANVPFDEQLLENDFAVFIDFLMRADHRYFLYRDFQSRNIMLRDQNVFFIDYQGGRKGPLQYDVASLLYDGKADIPPNYRNELLEFYLKEAGKKAEFNRENFLLYYDGFVLIRILQALGTYGFRGYYEKKSHFLLSIPYALKNISYLLDTMSLPIHIPELRKALEYLTEQEIFTGIDRDEQGLTVTITSFSYKKGIPQDYSPNGGGFVFDCRALPNPGRDKKYMSLNGKDRPVKDYLDACPETHSFKDHTFALTDASVNNYLSRNFNHLMVNFGCTGGQHRSVYMAEALAAHLISKYPLVKVKIKHTNLG